MIELSVQHDLAATRRALSEQQRNRLPVATQRALIKTARDVREAATAEMQKVFDKPTRWTIGAFKARPQKDFTVAVGVLDPNGLYRRAAFYLATQIAGGQRKNKAFELALQRVGVLPRGWYAVPGSAAKLDAYGNQSSGEIKQILSWFNGLRAGSQNATDATRARRRKGTKKTRGFELFSVTPGSRSAGRSRLPAGVYRRTFFGFGVSVEPLLIFVNRSLYRPRFDFGGVAQRVVRARYSEHLNAAFERQ